MWDQYQTTLRKVVKRITGKTVEQKLNEDVRQVLSDIKNENYKGVAKRKLLEISSMVPLLIEVFPNEAQKHSVGKNYE